MTEFRLIVTKRGRGKSRVVDPMDDPPPDPSIDSLVALARDKSNGESRTPLWLYGGEPTLRGDLPELCEGLTLAGHSIGLACDGLALAQEGAAGPLAAAGLRRVRVTLHAARADAHDFLVGQTGAARRAVRAIGRLKGLGLGLEIESIVTRPTMQLVCELVELASSLGVERVLFNRLVLEKRDDLVTLAPRFALLEPYLVQAVITGRERNVAVELHGFPECTARRVEKHIARPGSIHWLSAFPIAAPTFVTGCSSCPGLPRCAGAPADYVERFGAAEFRSEQALAPSPSAASVSPGVAAVPPPPPRAGRAPSTRLESVRALVGKNVDGDPLLLKAREPLPEVIRFRFGAPSRIACAACGDAETAVEPTRTIRMRLVHAAQEGAKVLRIASAGSLAHPSAAALLREATYLSYERVEVAGEASALAEVSDAELYPLRGISRLDIALYGPDAKAHDAHMGRAGAFEASLTAAQRFRKVTGAEVGSYAVLHDDEHVEAFARAWTDGLLPGEPCFRLSPAGGSLEDLVRAAIDLPEGPAKSALGRVLPRCLIGDEPALRPPDPGSAFGEVLEPAAPPSGSDRCGTFVACVCGGELSRRCPGIATGWKTALLK